MATSAHAFSKLKLSFEKLRFEPARASLGMPSLFRGFVAWTISSRISSVFQVGQLSSMRSTVRPLRTHSTFVLFSHRATTFAPSPAFLHFSANIAPGTTASSSAGSCRSTVILLTRILGRQFRHHYSPPLPHSWSGLARLCSSSKFSEVTRACLSRWLRSRSVLPCSDCLHPPSREAEC